MVLMQGRQPLTVDSELSFLFANITEIDPMPFGEVSRPHDLPLKKVKKKGKKALAPLVESIEISLFLAASNRKREVTGS